MQETDNKNNLGRYIKRKRKEKDLALRDLSDLTKISHAYLSIIEKGLDPRSGNPISPTLSTLQKLAKGLDVSLEELIYVNNCGDNMILPDGAIPFSMDNIRMIPVVGVISAGKPEITENLIDSYWPMDTRLLEKYCKDFDKAFYLRVRGNSLQPFISEGDIVFVVPEPVESGEIGVVMFNDHDACLKIVKFTQDNDMVVLISTNPDYEPVALHKSECVIIGRVALYIGEFKRRRNGFPSLR